MKMDVCPSLGLGRHRFCKLDAIAKSGLRWRVRLKPVFQRVIHPGLPAYPMDSSTLAALRPMRMGRAGVLIGFLSAVTNPDGLWCRGGQDA